MRTTARTRLLRAVAALVAIVVAVGVAVALADGPSEDSPDAPAGGASAPVSEVELWVDEPAGGGEPRGLVWLLCCGAWQPPAAHGLDLSDVEDRARLGAVAWTERGYRVATFAATGGDTAVAEAVAAFDRLRAEHPELPVCALGVSAAGHMALMVAAERPELGCVVAHSAPSSLPDLPAEPIPLVLPQSPRGLAEETFGAGPVLKRFSPLSRAGEIAASVRLVACSDDRIVPPSQARRMARALERRPGQARVELSVIEGETIPPGADASPALEELIHSCFVPPRAIARDRRAAVRFVAGELAER